MSRGPDFIIAGAPKCGTTALHAYLDPHPGVFLPEFKEPHHFGRDLTFVDQERPDLAAYLSLFEPAGPEQTLGEASVFYLFSKTAAEEIRAFNPAMRIVIMLRNPVDVIHSFHSQRTFNGTEDLAFEKALEAEPERARGERMPPHRGLVEALQYRSLGRFAEQVERYLTVFGRERLHVIVYEDFRADAEAEVRSVCRFLGVEPWVPEALPVVNANKEARIGWIRDWLWAPPPPLRRLGRAVSSQQARRRLGEFVRRLNAREQPRAPMDPELRRSLTREFAPDVERLAELIGRDLSAWLPS